MKRIIVTVFLILLIYSVGFASVMIEAEGNGKTLEEAKENARVALAEKVFPGTIVVETTTASSDSSSGNYSSSFSQKSSYSIVGEFPGFDYTVVSSKKNKYVVSTRIVGDTATLNFYANKLDEQKENVEEFYSRYISLDSDVSATERRKALALVIEYYYYYNMYSNIILSLGGTTTDVDIPVNLAILQVDYQSLLDEEENELLTKSSVNAITQEIKEELAKNAEAQEEYRKAHEEARVQLELQRRLILDQKITDIVNNANSIAFDNIDIYSGLESYASYIEVIKSADTSFVEACEEYDKLIKEQTDSVEKAFNEEAEAIRNRTYPRAYLDATGKPTEWAKEQRETEVNELREEKNKEKEEAVSTINAKLCSEIQKRYNYLEEAIALFEEKKFCVSSTTGDVSVNSVPVYDGSSFCWRLSVSFGEPIFLTINGIELKYSVLSGKKIPTQKAKLSTFISSSEYTDTVDLYDKLFTLEEYEFSVSFKIDLSLSGIMKIIPLIMDIRFADGKEITVSFGGEHILDATIDLNCTNYLSYSWLKKGKAGKELTELELKTKTDSNRAKSTNDEAKSTDTPSILGFELDSQFMYTFDNVFDYPIKGGYGFALEGRLFLSDFFFSVSGNMTAMDVSSLRLDKDFLYRYGAYGGIGYRFADVFTLACRMSCNKDLGIILNPMFGYGYYIASLRIDALLGVYINCKTGKLAFTLGAQLGGKVF